MFLQTTAGHNRGPPQQTINPSTNLQTCLKIRSNKHTEKKRKISEKETGKMLEKTEKTKNNLT